MIDIFDDFENLEDQAPRDDDEPQPSYDTPTSTSPLCSALSLIELEGLAATLTRFREWAAPVSALAAALDVVGSAIDLLLGQADDQPPWEG